MSAEPPDREPADRPGASSLMLRRYVEDVRCGRDAEAVGRLLDRTAERLLTICRRIGPPPGMDAEDLLQSAWAGQLGRLTRADGPPVADSAHFLRLAGRAIRQAKRDLLQKAKRWVGSASAADPGSGSGIDDGLRADIREALGRLPAEQQAVVASMTLEGFSRRETAAALSMSESAVRTHFEAARRQLLRSLAAYYDA